MVEIFNKSTYNRVYNKLSAEFIDVFCNCKISGLTTDQSIIQAKIKLKQSFIKEIAINTRSRRTILIAYDDTKNDAELIKRAIEFYHGFKK